MANLTNLKKLHLGYNFLGSEVPIILGSLVNLESLALNHNFFNGKLPSELGNLSNLQQFSIQGNMLRGDIPIELGALGLTSGGSDFRWNALYTDSESLRLFLNDKQTGGDWESTQTLAPIDLEFGQIKPTSLELIWSPIDYVSDAGNYDVYYSHQAGEQFIFYASTHNKSETSMTVTGLVPGTNYSFAVQSVTAPHTQNDNFVRSEFSEEIQTTTAVVPTLGHGFLGWAIIFLSLSYVIWSSNRRYATVLP